MVRVRYCAVFAAETGVPTDPTRDTAINMYQGVLPGLVMPLLGGQMFVWFQHQTVYKMMFGEQQRSQPSNIDSAHTHDRYCY